MYVVFILLFFTHYFVSLHSSILPFRETSRKSKQPSSLSVAFDDNQEDTTSLNDQCSENCPCLNCNYTLPAPKKVINPYKQELSNMVAQKPFSSICVKCVACIAIASEIENTIVSSSEECEIDPQKKKVLLEDVVKNINDLCSTGFKNFNLRAYGNHSIITNRFKCTSHIVSSMDGNWTKKLRELCVLYTSKMNLEEVSIAVLDSAGNLTDTMCRGTGVFRDCSNIKSHQNISMPVCNNCNC